MATSNDTSDASDRLLEFFERQAVRIPEPVSYTGAKGSISYHERFIKVGRFGNSNFIKFVV